MASRANERPSSDMAAGTSPAGVAPAVEVGAGARAVVLVEGLSDRVALEVLAERRGRDLDAEGIVIVPTGGATAIGSFAACFAGRGLHVGGLYDAGEQGAVARALARAGVGAATERAQLERLGFFACVDDLEDELIRVLGPAAVEAVIDRQGDLVSFRRLQRQPAQRDRPITAQLHRFLGTRSGRKWQYAALLTAALDLTAVPQPLDAVLSAFPNCSVQRSKVDRRSE